jgi:hypothetical protein
MAVIEFGFIFLRDLTVKNYMSQMVQRLERGQLNMSQVATALTNDSLMKGGQNPQVCTAWLASGCTDDGTLNPNTTMLTPRNSVTVGVTYKLKTLTPVGKLLNFTFPSEIIRRETVTVGGSQNLTCDPGEVIQSITGANPTCVFRDGDSTNCSGNQVLHKIHNNVHYCAGTDPCTDDQVLWKIDNGKFICRARDVARDCGQGEVLQRVGTGIWDSNDKVCVAVDEEYKCTGNKVLQTAGGGTKLCVDKDGTGAAQSCPSNTVMTGLSDTGTPLCDTPPQPSQQYLPGTWAGRCFDLWFCTPDCHLANHLSNGFQLIWPAILVDLGNGNQCGCASGWTQVTPQGASGGDSYVLSTCIKN